MARWKYRSGEKDDDAVKFGKMRKGRKTPKKSGELTRNFEVPEEDWQVPEGGFAARVVEVHKRYAFVSPEKVKGTIATRDVWLATLARRFLKSDRQERNLITVGDRVMCVPTDNRDTGIESELPTAMMLCRAPREFKLARRDPMNENIEHVIAANVEQIAIVASFLKPRIKWGLIDRYLTLAEEQRLDTFIVLNKWDLLQDEANDHLKAQCQEMTQVYRSLGYRVIEVCAENIDETPKALAELEEVFSDKITIVSGHSGVGKSSLVNLFDPEIVQEVEDDPDIFYKGRHTTTYSSFIKLQDINGYIVDTPGVRSLLLGERNAIELTYAFREMRPLMNRCKFRECRHIDEPQCAVLKAVEDGAIHPRRYQSYTYLLLGESGREGRGGLADEEGFEDLLGLMEEEI